MDDCLFCKIASGEIPSQKVYEDNATFAFLDIKPVNPGHTLVIPKKHTRNIFDIEKEDWAAVLETGRRVAKAVKEATGAEGLNVHVNNEPVAGQVIFHAHIHLIPRHEGDGRELWHGHEVANEELDKLQKQIIAALS